MLQLRGNNYITLKKCEADKNSQEIYVYEKLPLIACKTNGDYGIVNGEEFIVKSFNEKFIILKSDDPKISKDISVKAADLTKIFYPAYCLTIHRVQGTTFDGPYKIFEWEILDNKLKYVALSRSTHKNNINFVTLQKPKRYTPTVVCVDMTAK